MKLESKTVAVSELSPGVVAQMCRLMEAHYDGVSAGTGSPGSCSRGTRLSIGAAGGSLALPVAWGRLMLSLEEVGAGQHLYWLLTSKGYKTYRFLPVFFNEFYPCFSSPTPKTCSGSSRAWRSRAKV